MAFAVTSMGLDEAIVIFVFCLLVILTNIRISIMDTKVQALKDAFESYAADYQKTIDTAKAEVQAAIDRAIANDRAGRNTDLDALKSEIEAAHAKITPPAPPFEQSNQ